MAELTFEEYLDLVTKQAKEKLTKNETKFFDVLKLARENAKEADKKITASLKSSLNLPVKYKNEPFVQVIQACCDDYSLAMEDMKDPEKFAAILSVLNEKLAKDGDAFDMNTPENKMLGLANRYALSARECQYLEKWSLFAFYMRSLAYFIPQLIHKANLKEEQVLKKIESRLSNIAETQVGLPQSFIGETDEEVALEDKLQEILSEEFDKITDDAKKEQYKEIEEAKKDLEKKSDYELLDMYYHGDIPKGAKANKEELIYGILQDRFGDEVKYFYKEPVSEAAVDSGYIETRDGKNPDSIKLKSGEWCYYISKNGIKYAIHNTNGTLRAFKTPSQQQVKLLPDMLKKITTAAEEEEKDEYADDMSPCGLTANTIEAADAKSLSKELKDIFEGFYVDLRRISNIINTVEDLSEFTVNRKFVDKDISDITSRIRNLEDKAIKLVKTSL